MGTIGDKSYHNYVSEDQIAWLKKDLALVEDKAAPLFIMMHAPLAYPNASFGNTYYDEARARELLAGFEGFSEVHVLTGHSHDNRNCQLTDAVMDHNTGAVCACWWWSDVYSGRHICKDGTPGGYAVYELEDRDLTWYYKGTGISRDVQFRTYDMNKVREFYTPAVIEILSQWPRRADDGAGDDYFDVADNTVFINVWNWDSQWTLRVTENGRELPVERVWHRDPLHTICLDYARILNGLDPVNDWESLRHSHMFRVVASSPRTSLHVEATDRFGRRYEETMRRPKEFTADMN